MIFAIAFVKNRFGSAGLYPLALAAGLTDVDAITLSSSNMILLATLANLAFKAACACTLGSRELRRRIMVVFGLALAGGAGLLCWL